MSTTLCTPTHERVERLTTDFERLEELLEIARCEVRRATSICGDGRKLVRRIRQQLYGIKLELSWLEYDLRSGGASDGE